MREGERVSSSLPRPLFASQVRGRQGLRARDVGPRTGAVVPCEMSMGPSPSWDFPRPCCSATKGGWLLILSCGLD